MEMMSKYYDKNGSPLELMERAKKVEDDEYKRVALTKYADKGITVSTVWLGADYDFSGEGPILIFETMIFCSEENPLDQEQERYTTLQQALEGHERMCKLVEEQKSI